MICVTPATLCTDRDVRKHARQTDHPAQMSTAIHTSVTNTPNTINTSQSFDTERSPKGGRDRLGGARSPARELRT